jgi:hypothetical protein
MCICTLSPCQLIELAHKQVLLIAVRRPKTQDIGTCTTRGSYHAASTMIDITTLVLEILAPATVLQDSIYWKVAGLSIQRLMVADLTLARLSFLPIGKGFVGQSFDGQDL